MLLSILESAGAGASPALLVRSHLASRCTVDVVAVGECNLIVPHFEEEGLL